jgi:two-component system, chemotaxis family, chemotaxis protein CheY
MSASESRLIIIADAFPQTRNLLAGVLRSVGLVSVLHASGGRELLELTGQFHPRIVITTSRLPEVSGLEFTRLIRAGYKNVSRQTSIIVMSNTATTAFLSAARDSGADELLVRPFTASAVLSRIQSAIERPREFVESSGYVGPSRRRRWLESYNGPMRRFTDPTDGMSGASPWESEPSRQAVRSCVKAISQMISGLSTGDRRKLQQIFAAAKETQAIADETNDAMLGEAAKSLGRYITAIGAKGVPDPEVLTTHIDTMHTLGMLTSAQNAERQELIDGLVRIVDKKLGRSTTG